MRFLALTLLLFLPQMGKLPLKHFNYSLIGLQQYLHFYLLLGTLLVHLLYHLNYLQHQRLILLYLRLLIDRPYHQQHHRQQPMSLLHLGHPLVALLYQVQHDIQLILQRTIRMSSQILSPLLQRKTITPLNLEHHLLIQWKQFDRSPKHLLHLQIYLLILQDFKQLLVQFLLLLDSLLEQQTRHLLLMQLVILQLYS